MTTLHTTPRADGFRMPAEWEPHAQTWLLWPERPDNWRLGAKPAQAAFAAVARAIARFEPVTVGVSAAQYANACARLAHGDIRVVELSSDDAWLRDSGPTFVVDARGEVRGVDWTSTPGAASTAGCTRRGTATTRWPARSSSSNAARATAPRASCWRAAPSTSTARAPC